jgi:hypothetical protein
MLKAKRLKPIEVSELRMKEYVRKMSPLVKDQETLKTNIEEISTRYKRSSTVRNSTVERMRSIIKKKASDLHILGDPKNVELYPSA